MKRWSTVMLLVLGAGCGEVVAPDAGLPTSSDGSVVDPPREDGGTGFDASPPDAGELSLRVELQGAGSGAISSPDGEISCPGKCTTTVTPGQRLVLTSSAAANSTFVGWSIPACATASSCAVTVRADTTITGEFALRSRQLSVRLGGRGAGRVVSDPAGIDCGEDCEEEWLDGTRIILEARPDADSTFQRWRDGACPEASNPICALSLTDNLAATADFEVRRESVNVQTSGTGAGRVRSTDGRIDCISSGGGTCRADYEVGTQVELTAEPDSASTFVGWAGDCAGASSCRLTVSGDRAVTATFRPITEVLSVSIEGPGEGSVRDGTGAIDCGASCSTALPIGSSASLSALPDRYYRFVGWSGACSSSANTCDTTITADTQVRAVFEHEPQLVAGFWHACAISRAGALRCWGANNRGQLGYGHLLDVGDDELPRTAGDVSAGARVERVALGFEHTCAILSTGRVRCWGHGGNGRLGYGDASDRGGTSTSVPALLPDVGLPADAMEIVAGFAHTCALLETGEIYCWGSNQFGQLGYAGSVTEVGTTQGNLPQAAGPVPVGGTVVDISSGSRMTCVHLQPGDVRCFGDAEVGQLGYGNRTDIGVGQNNTPAAQPPVPLGGPIAELYPSLGAHTCVRLGSGGVRCWGTGFEGRLGYGNTNNVGDAITPDAVPVLVLPGLPIAVSAGGVHTCILFSSTDRRCFGANDDGTLGYGDTEHRGDTTNERPVDLPPVMTGGTVTSVSAGGFFTCVRFANDDIACWGNNTRGQLGFGDTAQRGHTAGTIPSANGTAAVF